MIVRHERIDFDAVAAEGLPRRLVRKRGLLGDWESIDDCCSREPGRSTRHSIGGNRHCAPTYKTKTSTQAEPALGGYPMRVTAR